MQIFIVGVGEMVVRSFQEKVWQATLARVYELFSGT